MFASTLRMHITRALCLLLAVVLFACDSGNPNEDEDAGDAIVGSAHVTLEGAVNGSFSGSAMFTVNGTTDFILMLTDGSPRAASEARNVKAIVFAGEEGRPNGVAALGIEEALYTLYTDVRNSDAVVIATPDTGSITFTTSNADRLAGHFAFTGKALDGDLTEIGAVTIEGTFDARNYAGIAQ